MLNSPTSTYTVRVGRRVMANKTLLDEYIDKVSKFQLKMQIANDKKPKYNKGDSYLSHHNYTIFKQEGL